MKNFFLILLSLLLVAAIAAGGYGWFAYAAIGEERVPQVSVTVLGTTLRPSSYIWHQPVIGTLFYKDLSATSAVAPQLAGNITPPSAGGQGLAVTLPQGFDAEYLLSRGGVVLFQGSPAGWDDALIEEEGSYYLSIECTLPSSGKGYGSFVFNTVFVVETPETPPAQAGPFMQTGSLSLQQGDIFTLRLTGLPEGTAPTAKTELGMAQFVQTEAGSWFAAIPASNLTTPGSYPVQVQAGAISYNISVTVEAYPFDEQNLIIDTTAPEITEANSSAAYQQYREKIPPLFQTADDEIYWSGVFQPPVEGRISTQFGEIRYTNGDYSAGSPHNGMDFAVPEGTPVLAPNNGRVIMAESLLNTGNTIVIEHGGGLKSYYFHLSALNVEAGQMVTTGQTIGAVGTTGYSTGPHLHYEMRIGNKPISPSMLFSETAGLYALSPEN